MAEKKEESEKKEGEKPAPKSKKKLFIIIGGAVALVIVLVVVGILLFSGKSKPAEGGEEGAAVESGGGERVAEGETQFPAIFPLEVFIVNLSVKGSFLKALIQLEFLEPTLPPTIESDVPRIRDAMIRVLTAKTAPELLSADGKEKLRQEIKDVVNETLGAEEIGNVYFTEFIIQ